MAVKFLIGNFIYHFYVINMILWLRRYVFTYIQRHKFTCSVVFIASNMKTYYDSCNTSSFLILIHWWTAAIKLLMVILHFMCLCGITLRFVVTWHSSQVVDQLFYYLHTSSWHIVSHVVACNASWSWLF